MLSSLVVAQSILQYFFIHIFIFSLSLLSKVDVDDGDVDGVASQFLEKGSPSVCFVKNRDLFILSRWVLACLYYMGVCNNDIIIIFALCFSLYIFNGRLAPKTR
jgi:hypothetical protein